MVGTGTSGGGGFEAALERPRRRRELGGGLGGGGGGRRIRVPKHVMKGGGGGGVMGSLRSIRSNLSCAATNIPPESATIFSARSSAVSCVLARSTSPSWWFLSCS